MQQKDYIKLISKNKKIHYNYIVETYYEAGIVLTGTEVKSLRMGKVNLKDSYATIKNQEIFIHQIHISAYPFARYDNHDPERKRKLLLHNYEIKKLYGKTKEKGYSLIPSKIYFKNNKIKLSIGLAKGKQQYDKRETIKHREQNREMERKRKQYTG